jgi:hypothetical protein
LRRDPDPTFESSERARDHGVTASKVREAGGELMRLYSADGDHVAEPDCCPRVGPRCTFQLSRKRDLQGKGVSDGTRTRGRRDHNPNKSGASECSSGSLSAFERIRVALIALNLDPA